MDACLVCGKNVSVKVLESHVNHCLDRQSRAAREKSIEIQHLLEQQCEDQIFLLQQPSKRLRRSASSGSLDSGRRRKRESSAQDVSISDPGRPTRSTSTPSTPAQATEQQGFIGPILQISFSCPLCERVCFPRISKRTDSFLVPV